LIQVKVLSLTLYDCVRMEQLELLKKYGLFDARVPRYTSYPPANHFQNDVGGENQQDWLRAVPDKEEVSLYVHIPFCKRLCWFCACRTQGTQTMRPVDHYVDVLRKEIMAVRAELPKTVKMVRLHLGGGTPTLLSPKMMTTLLNTIFDAFDQTYDFEFSVEIDPTEARSDLLDVLVDCGLNRASVGVQDFNPSVQAAIGRLQSFDETESVVNYLRRKGVKSLNVDVLYGLPHQTRESYAETLRTVLLLRPDRLAIYGYAHVPWMSKRQVLIKEGDLPDNQMRFMLSSQTVKLMKEAGYGSVGIDHFALPHDNLIKVSRKGGLRRNFQGYTDDPARYLIGFGASAISLFPQGYCQELFISKPGRLEIIEDAKPLVRILAHSIDEHAPPRVAHSVAT